MIAPKFVAASILVALGLPAAAASAAESRSTPFTHFGAKPVIELRGDAGSATIDFGSRADELVTRATLHLRYAWSPALSASVAHIRLKLNGEAVGILPVPAEGAGKSVARDVEIDPRLIVGFNKLVFELVAARGPGAEDPARPGLWAEVSGTSTLELAISPLAVADDLAILPEPFFDKRDQRRVTIPFAFGANPSLDSLAAGAIVASWFGRHALWRGARFPASLDSVPAGHAVVFAANGERPSFLASVPPAAGPELRIATNPADGRSKLLLVLGRDAAEVRQAAEALALGATALSGPSLRVKKIESTPPRVAYDAPGMVRIDRPMTLGELIEWPQQLQAAGRPPVLDPIRVDLRVPPDLVTGRGAGVPITLRLEYTPPPCTGDARLEVSVNDELLRTLPLRIAPEPVAEAKEVFIPAFRLRGRSQLQVGFRFAPRDEAACRDTRTDIVKAVVTPDSTVDFSGFPRYARLPDLRRFASVGYPFARLADLSQTVVVLPDKPSAADIETMLTLVGRIGDATGYPATRVRLAGAKDDAALAGADLLVIGAAPQQGLIDKWSASMPMTVGGQARKVSGVSFEGSAPLAAMFEFESPLTSGRSVIVVTAVAADQMLRVLDALENPEMRKAMRGGAAFVLPGKVESVLAERTWTTGFMPPWSGLGYWLSERPVVLGAVAVAFATLLAFAAWGVRRLLQARRRSVA